jgi:hypothetical protein
MQQEAQRRRPVTGAEVIEIVGKLDDGAVAKIIATGATAAELLEAHTWLSSDDYLHRRLHRAPRGAVAELCRILEEELRPPEDPLTGESR